MIPVPTGFVQAILVPLDDNTWPLVPTVVNPVPPLAVDNVPITLVVRSIEPASIVLVTFPVPMVVTSPEVVTSPVSEPGVCSVPLLTVNIPVPEGAGPVAPVAPAVPLVPLVPAGPVNPVGPVAPVGPVKPIGPVAPAGPVNPVGPVAPVGPAKPIGPVAPARPCVPVAPVAP